jgi:transcriptional regulator with XRE-family HTH domain
MPQKPKLPALHADGESIGKRLAQLRKARGLTQIDLCARVGITQSLLSSYERDRLKLSAEMAMHLARHLKVGVEELLGTKAAKGKGNGATALSLKLTKRMQRIGQLPASEQRALLKTIDRFLKGAEK